MVRFLEKVVIVTGASSGIGQATAIAFAKEGAKLCLIGRNVERLAETKEACESAGSKEVLTLQVDLANFGHLSTIVDKTVETFGKIDVLINNAAWLKTLEFEKITVDDYNMQMNVNLRAPFFLSQKVLPYLEKSKGNIVNISSFVSLVARHPANMVYAASKAALDHFTRCLSSVRAASGVRVNNINPAAVDTPIWDIAFPDKALRDKRKSAVRGKQPLGLIPAENIATTILFVASNDAQYMTGVTFPVDGGAILCTPTEY